MCTTLIHIYWIASDLLEWPVRLECKKPQAPKSQTMASNIDEWSTKKINNNFDKSMMGMGEETYQKPPYNIHMCRDMLPFSLNCVTVEWHHIGPDIGVVRFGESGACVRFEVAIGKTAIHLWFRNVGIRQCVYSISLASTIDDLLLCEGCDSSPINTEQRRQPRPGLCARSECEIL